MVTPDRHTDLNAEQQENLGELEELLRNAQLHEQQGNLENAIEQFREAVRIQPDRVDARCNIFHILLTRKENFSAISELKQIIHFDKNCDVIREKISPRLEKILEDDPNNLTILICLGEIYDRSGDVDRCIDIYKRIVAIRPSSEIFYQLGLLLSRVNRLEQALENFRIAVQLNPSYTKARFSMGRTLLILGKADQAARELEHVLKLDPSFDSARVLLSHAVYAKESMETYLGYLDQVTGDGLAREFANNVVISLPFPCGMLALVEMLLHLDVMVQGVSGFRNKARRSFPTWEKTGNGYRVTAAGRYPASLIGKLLDDADKTYALHGKVGFLLEHQLRLIAIPADRRFLFVRDPVDSMYAYYRRENTHHGKNYASFNDFLQRMHYLIDIPYRGMVLLPVDLYAFYVLFCLSAYPDIYVIRFEDLRKDPFGTMENLLRYAKCPRTEQQIRDAISAAPFRNTQMEWPTCMTESEYSLLLSEEPIHFASKKLNYIEETGIGTDLFHYSSSVMSRFVEFADGYVKEHAKFVNVSQFAELCRLHMMGTTHADLNRVRGSYDPREVNAFDAIMATSNLVRGVFKDYPVQPAEMLARVMTQMSCVLAHCADKGRFRKLFEAIPSITGTNDTVID